MLLKYVWIKSFRNITNQGFHICDETMFLYDAEEGHLTVTTNESYFPGLYGPNIASLTALIGKNGAGKSNFLDFLLLRIGSHENGGFTSFEFDFECLVVFDKRIYVHSTLRITNEAELSALGYSIYFFDQTILYATTEGPTMEEVIKDIRMFDYLVVYYSNTFDLKPVINSHHSLDISTRSLLYSDAYTPIRYRVNTIRGDRERVHAINAHKVEEFRRQMEFIAGSHANVPFKLPQEISIYLDFEQNIFFGRDGAWFDKNNLTHIYEFTSVVNSYYRPGDHSLSERQFLDTFRILLLYRLVVVLAIQFPDRVARVPNEGWRRFILEGYVGGEILVLQDDIGTLARRLINLVSELVELAEVPVHWLEEAGGSVWQRFGRISVRMEGANNDTVLNFIAQYSEVVGQYAFLTYFWPGLSSGENNMLALYSRFYAIRNHDRLRAAKNLIVAIDEGETYFHPSWQRQYLSLVVKYLNSIFSDKSVQLIITSNSPFIASDIPRSKINLMDVDEQGRCVVVRDGLLEETFGANIHALFANAFFMPDTLMGEISREKVEMMIRIINSNFEFNDEIRNLEELRKHISLVGEPIIRQLLLQMLESLNQ